MATNYDSFPITPAMLAMAWVKPPVLYYPGGTVTGSNTIYANATDDYRPRSDLEKAGAPGGPNGAVQPLPAPYPPLVQDPNYIIAATIEPGQEKTPYPNTVLQLTAIEVDPTLVLPPDPM